MALLLTLIGITLIFAVFTDVFLTLFSDAGKLTVSRLVGKAFWRRLHRLGIRRLKLLYAAGPVAFLATLGAWLLLLAVGGALVYWTYMPSAFAFGEGLDAAARTRFVDALYFSLGYPGYARLWGHRAHNPLAHDGRHALSLVRLGVLLATLS